MSTEEYLVAKVGELNFGIYCRDVKNVYAQEFKLARLYDKSSIFRGIAQVNGELMQIIDLRRRIGMSPCLNENGVLTLVSFQTSVSSLFAVIVDEIIGMHRLSRESLVNETCQWHNKKDNINLLFPTVSLLDDGRMIYLLDSTYLEKTEPIEESSGDLELF